MATPRPLRVLVADDEHLIADTLVAIFRNKGFDASSAYSGYSAIETAVTLKPDVIISDVLMPGMNGIEAALSISKLLPDSKFLLFSGHAGSQDSIRLARSQGLNFVFMHKPVPPGFLVEYLEDCALKLNAGQGA
jgi:CheY-like chemotaxis protein